jgi:hypothetical protein
VWGLAALVYSRAAFNSLYPPVLARSCAMTPFLKANGMRARTADCLRDCARSDRNTKLVVCESDAKLSRMR